MFIRDQIYMDEKEISPPFWDAFLWIWRDSPKNDLFRLVMEISLFIEGA